MSVDVIPKDKSAIHARMALIAMCIMYVVWTGVCWNTVTLYANSIITEWGITRTQFMLAVTLISGGNALVSLLLYGTIQAKLGVRKMVLIGGLMCSAGYVVFALAHNLFMLYTAATLFGVGVSALNSNTAFIVLNSWFKKGVGKLMGIPQTCGSIAGIIFATVFAMLITSLGWRIPMWITCGVSLAATIIILLLYKGDPESIGEKPMYAEEVETTSTENIVETGVGVKRMFKTPQFYMLAVAYLLVGVIGYAILGNLALITSDMGHANLAGTVLSVALIASAVFFIPGGAICDKLGTKWMVAICMLLLIVAMLLLRTHGLSLVLLYVVGALVGIGYDACLLPAGISVKEAFGEKEYGKKVGIVCAFAFIGISFGPTIMALFYDMSGSYSSALRIFIILAACTALLIFPATKRVME